MLQAILLLCVGVALIGLIMYLADRAPFIDAEAKVIIHWILLVVMVIFVVYGLLGLIGIVAPFGHAGSLSPCR